MNTSPPQSKPQPNRASRRTLRRLCGIGFISILGLFLFATVAFWIVTRSWFIVGQITPELAKRLGGDVTIGQAAYQGNGSVVFTDIKLRARSIPGPAGEIASIGRADVSVDFTTLLTSGFRIKEIKIDGAVVRVSEDAHDSGRLNLWALKPDWPEGSNKPLPSPPVVHIQRASLEFGWHDHDEFFLLGRRLVSGEMQPTAGASELYNFVLSEVDAFGAGVSDGIFMKGEWNASTNELHSRLDGLELDDRVYRMCPHVVRVMWDRMDLKGKVDGVEMQWQPDEPFAMKLAIKNIALTLPLETKLDWARYRDGQIEGTSSRPRMHFRSGIILVDSESLTLENLTGALGSDDDRENLVAVPYVINFSLTSLPPLEWEHRDEWLERVLQTSPFSLHFKMDEFSLKRDGQGESPAVDLPQIVAKVLEKFQVTDWVLSTTVDVSRPPPTTNEQGELVAAKTVTAGHAYLHKASGRYQKFPYQLDDVDAYLQFDNDRVIVHYLTGRGAGNSRLRLSGEIAPPENDAAVALRLVGANVPVDDRLRDALRGNELQAFDMMFNKSLSDSMAAAGVLPDQHAIDEATTTLHAAQQQLEQLKQQANTTGAVQAGAVAELEGQIRRLQRFIDAGAFQLGGIVDLDLKIDRVAGPHKPTVTTGTINIQSIGMMYEKFPYPLRVTSGTIDWQQDRIAIATNAAGEGLTLVTPGGGKGSVTGELLLSKSGQNKKLRPNLAMRIEDDAMNEAVFAAMPLSNNERAEHAGAAKWPGGTLSKAAQLVRGIGLTGAANYDGTITTDENGRVDYNFQLSLQNCHAKPTQQLANALGAADELWPSAMTLNDVTGAVQISRDNVVLNGITGSAGETDIAVNGVINLAADDLESAVTIDLQNLPVEPYVLNATSGGQAARARELWNTYQPQGEFNATLDYRSNKAFGQTVAFSIQPSRVSVMLDQQRLAMKHVSGNMKFFNGSVAFEDLMLDLADEHDANEGSLHLTGGGSLRDGAEDLQMQGAWTNARFESPLVSHLLKSFADSGVATRFKQSEVVGTFDAQFNVASAARIDMPQWMFEIMPRTIDLLWNEHQLKAVVHRGAVTLAPDTITISDLHGHDDEGTFELSGTVDTRSPVEAMLGIGYSGKTQSDLVQAFLPTVVKDALNHIEFSDDGPTSLVDCELHMTQVPQVDGRPLWNIGFKGPIQTTAATLDGGVAFSNVDGAFGIDLLHQPGKPLHLEVVAFADRAAAMGQALANVQAQFKLTDDGRFLRMSDFRADADDGVITAQAWTGIGEEREYEAMIEMVDIPLDRFAFTGASSKESPPARPGRKRAARGELFANVNLSGVRGEPQSRRGRAMVRVLQGKMVNIPLLVQLMQVAQFTMPLGGNLDYADADMYIAGDRIFFERIFFESTLGNNAMLQLTGKGEMNVDTFELDTQFSSRGAVPIVREIVGELGDALYNIEVTGPLANPKARIVPLPVAN